MKRLLLSFFACTFILWLLPLGVFIKASKEKELCGGMRAICMCKSNETVQGKSTPLAGVSLKTSDAGAKEHTQPSGGAASYFTSMHQDDPASLIALSLEFQPISFYTLSFIHQIEHVPKA